MAMKEVHCRMCGELMKVDIKALAGICWKCIAKGKAKTWGGKDAKDTDRKEQPDIPVNQAIGFPEQIQLHDGEGKNNPDDR